MNFSLSYTCVLKLRKIINDYNPDMGFEEFARDVKEGIKFTKLVSQRNYLEKLVKRGEATPEVISLARRRYSTEVQNNKRYKAEEKRIMMFRIREKNQNLYKKKKEWTEKSKVCEAAFQRDGKLKYRDLKRAELNRVWNLEKLHKSRKLDRFPQTPDNYQGVLLGDNVLEEKYGNLEPVPIILGGIENVSENIKSFLKLGLKYRIFPKVGKKPFG